MKDLLYLVHRLPYPPNKGDKIPSFNLLRHFAKHYRVHLGTFVDDPDDWRYESKVREYCEDACIVGLNPKVARLRSLRGLLTGEALSLPYYRNRRLKRWAEGVVERIEPQAVFVFSGSMGQFLTQSGAHCVLDLVDVDSEKFRAYAGESPWPLSWLYRREADRLLAHERAMAARCDVTLFVTADEAGLFRGLAPEVADKVVHRNQGVDSAYFDPARDYLNPYQPDEQVMVFTGAMDYRPNVDAVTWFADEVFPQIKQQVPQVRFCIVGMNPGSAVRELAGRDGIRVTGGVPDVRPYVAHAAAVVAPLRIARGLQNKVLEAMAMERPVIATPAAMVGIETCPGFEPVVEEDAGALAIASVALLQGGRQTKPGARECVLTHYDWDTNLERIADLLGPNSR